jgi:RNA polymerase sigma factor (sigma-70 family)
MNEDPPLLRQFVEQNSEAAFRELVRQRIDFVYAAALRQVGGDAHLAQEVAQNVFLDLARKAPTLVGRSNLAGWLYTSTRFAAAKALRSRMRRLNHETEAHTMNEILSDTGAASPRKADWQELRPVLDAAMHELGEGDREAILLRYFEGRTFADVGAAIGLAENSARMRVERALEKLRGQLARRGITSTAAALGATLVAQPVVAAPPGLAAAVAGSALEGLAGAGALAVTRFLSLQNLAAAGVVSLADFFFYGKADARLETQLAAESARQVLALTEVRAGNAALRAENQRVAAEQTARAQAATAAAKLDPLARLRALVVLIREGSLGRVQWRSYGIASEIVTPPVADLFALTPEESRQLTEHLDRAKNEIAALTMAHASIERAPGQIVMTIPAIPAARERYERLREGVQQALGAERFSLMQEVGWGASLERYLDLFGLTPRTVRILHVTMPRLPEYPYAIEQQQSLQLPAGRPPPPAMRAPPGPDNHPGSMDFAALKLNLGPFAKFVPEDF